MYYFYLNFPNYKSKNIMIHSSECGDCKSGIGKRGSLSNEKGFWAGPFETYLNAELCLEELLKKVNVKFAYAKCKKCIKK